MPKIIPVGDRLLLRMIPPPEEAKGMVIPDEAKERPQQAHIVAVGDSCTDGRWHAGDKVIVGRHSGTTITLNYYDEDTWVRVIRENEILARLLD